MRLVRMLTGGLGLAAAAYGAIQLLDLGLGNLWAAVVWLAGGVILHDAVLAPLTIVLAFLAVRVARGRVPAPVAGGAIVLATVTLVAVPVLGRFGARPDNATLLDRNYVLGWLVLATLTLVVVLAATVAPLLAARRKGGDRGASAGRR